MSFQIVLSIAAVVAALSIQDAPCDPRNLKTISVEQAKALVQTGQDIYLDRCEEVSDACLKILVGSRSVLSLNGLVKLSFGQAEILRQATCFIELNGIKTVDSATLGVMSGCVGGVSFGGLNSISVEQAEQIRRFKTVYLDGLLSLPVAVARELSRTDKPGLIRLRGLSEIDEASIKLLCMTRKEIHLDKVKIISKEVAESIASGSACFRFGLIGRLQDDVFLALNQTRCRVELPQVRHLSKIQAYEYRNGSGKLLVDGLVEIEEEFLDSLKLLGISSASFACVKEISARVAMKLGGFHWHSISLPSLSVITPEQAYWLGMGGGALDLSGLSYIDEISAKYVAEFLGVLDLSGLKKISEGVAERLGEHVGVLELSGLLDIDDVCAAKLSRHLGSIYLQRLADVSDRSFLYLSKIRPLGIRSLFFTTPNMARLKLLWFRSHIIDGDVLLGFPDGFFSARLWMLGLKELSIGKVLVCFFSDRNKIWLNPRRLSVAHVFFLCLSAAHIDFRHCDGRCSIGHYLPLCFHKGTVWIQDLDEDSCLYVALISFNRGNINFGKIKNLDDLSVYWLSRHRGVISFREVVKISKAQADVLSKHDGSILISPKLIEFSSEDVKNTLLNDPFVLYP